MKVCEMCESDNYCKHCGTCHDCLSESIDNAEKQLAAAKEEVKQLTDLIMTTKKLIDDSDSIQRAEAGFYALVLSKLNKD